MKASEAKELTNKFIKKEADEEVVDILINIKKAAQAGKTSISTYFNYDSNVERMVELGYELTVKAEQHSISGDGYTTYYTVDWG